VEVVAAPLTGIPVPARAVVVLEGEIDPSDERPDGPLGEISGYSLAFPRTPTFRVRGLHHRRDAVYQALLPTGPDGDALLGAVAEASILPQARGLFPFAQAFHVVPGTFGSSIVVRVGNANRGQVRALLCHLLSAGMVKKAVAVAGDVDAASLSDVEWSLATRCQPDRDVLVLEGLAGQVIDPSGPEPGLTSKIGIDATGYGRAAGLARASLAPGALRRAEALLHRR
jgi:2,5-furandicarboxylate decarboxylase 1